VTSHSAILPDPQHRAAASRPSGRACVPTPGVRPTPGGQPPSVLSRKRRRSGPSRRIFRRSFPRDLTPARRGRRTLPTATLPGSSGASIGDGAADQPQLRSAVRRGQLTARHSPDDEIGAKSPPCRTTSQARGSQPVIRRLSPVFGPEWYTEHLGNLLATPAGTGTPKLNQLPVEYRSLRMTK